MWLPSAFTWNSRSFSDEIRNNFTAHVIHVTNIKHRMGYGSYHRIMDYDSYHHIMGYSSYHILWITVTVNILWLRKPWCFSLCQKFTKLWITVALIKLWINIFITLWFRVVFNRQWIILLQHGLRQLLTGYGLHYF